MTDLFHLVEVLLLLGILFGLFRLDRRFSESRQLLNTAAEQLAKILEGFADSIQQSRERLADLEDDEDEEDEEDEFSVRGYSKHLILPIPPTKVQAGGENHVKLYCQIPMALESLTFPSIDFATVDCTLVQILLRGEPLLARGNVPLHLFSELRPPIRWRPGERPELRHGDCLELQFRNESSEDRVIRGIIEGPPLVEVK